MSSLENILSLTDTSHVYFQSHEKPLPSMSAGELSVMMHGVDNDLERILELSTRWGAVVLVKEYDVFLEHHSLSDMHGNILGSVFP